MLDARAAEGVTGKDHLGARPIDRVKIGEPFRLRILPTHDVDDLWLIPSVAIKAV
jgi:hypothetical protein